ncbi:MAG: hypothetical protein ACRDHY_16115, partial [Anaerolineales bacterium]
MLKLSIRPDLSLNATLAARELSKPPELLIVAQEPRGVKLERRLAKIVEWASRCFGPPPALDLPLPAPRLLKSGKRKRLHEVDLPSGRFILKQYRSLPPGRWWQAGREARLMERARRRGVPLLPPDAVLSHRSWGALLFRQLPGARALQEVLLEPPGPGPEGLKDRRRLLARYGEFCRAVHQ